MIIPATENGAQQPAQHLIEQQEQKPMILWGGKEWGSDAKRAISSQQRQAKGRTQRAWASADTMCGCAQSDWLVAANTFYWPLRLQESETLQYFDTAKHECTLDEPCSLLRATVVTPEIRATGVPLTARGRRKEEEGEGEIIRLPWRGQCGRAAAARALCACCAAGYAKDCTGSRQNGLLRCWLC
jgi:hypothetical protein